MNIGFGKLGKVLNFNKYDWSSSGGDYEPIVFIETLAKKFPNDNFYLISKNNYKGNIPNLFDFYKDKPTGVDILDWVEDNILDLELNMMYVLGGPSSRAAIPGVLNRIDGTGKRKIMVMLRNYAAPVLMALNKTQVPYVYIATDVRHTQVNSEDLFNIPEACFGQGVKSTIWKHIIDYDNLDTVEGVLEFEYYPFETLRLLIEQRPTKEDIQFRLDNFDSFENTIVLLNQGDADYTKRLRYLKDLIVNKIDADIYGIWKTPKEDVSFIKSPIRPYELNDYISRYKYSVIFPLEQEQDWVTPKFYEVLNNLTIPFVYYKYDIHCRLNLDPFLIFETAAELKFKIDTLNNNKELYELMLIDLYDNYLFEENYTGERVEFFHNLNKDIWRTQ